MRWAGKVVREGTRKKWI